MLQFMVACLVIGSIAVMTVRKQKRLNASLFDQRKYGAQQPKRNSGQNNSSEGEIEFSTMMTAEETAPLVLMGNGAMSSKRNDD